MHLEEGGFVLVKWDLETKCIEISLCAVNPRDSFS